MEPLRAQRRIRQPHKEEDNLWVWLCVIGPFVLIAIAGGTMFLEKLERQHARQVAIERQQAAFEREQLEAQLAAERQARTQARVSTSAANSAASAAVNRYYDNRSAPPAPREPTAKERYERTAEIYRSMRTTPPPSSRQPVQQTQQTASSRPVNSMGWECNRLAQEKDELEALMRDHGYGNGQRYRDRLNTIWGRMVELGCAR